MIGLSLLRDYLRLTESEHEDDDLIMEFEAAAVATVQSFTQIVYGPEGEVVEYVRGVGTADLYLALYPSGAPSEVIEHAVPGDAGTEITSDGWVLRDTRLVRKSGVWTRGYEYQVTYAAGYGDGQEPADVRQAVMSIVGVLYRGRGKDGLKTETVGGTASSYSYGKTDEAIKEIVSLLPRRGVFA